MGAYKKTHQENFPDTCCHGETVQYIENWLIGDFPKLHSEKSKKDRETCNDNFLQTQRHSATSTKYQHMCTQWYKKTFIHLAVIEGTAQWITKTSYTWWPIVGLYDMTKTKINARW